MTETTALLRAIHYDIVGVIGFLVALHADGRAGIKRDTNGDPLAPLPKRAKPRGQREAESRRRGNAASAKARGKRGARL